MRLFYFLLLPFLLQAQTRQDSLSADSSRTEIVKIELKDGSVLIGTIVLEDENNLTIKTKSGIKSEIPRTEIVKSRVVTDKMVKGEVWESDPNKTRLFFSPTGRPLNKGEGYFAVYELFFPFVAVGLTNNFTLAGGMSLFPGADEQLFYIAPKFTFLDRNDIDLSAGVLYMRIPSVSDGAGIVYGVGTFGDNDRAFTAGLGYGFAGEDFADSPLLTLGGELRVSRYLKLISENWIFIGEDVSLFSAGIRFFAGKLAGDFGFFFPQDADFAMPWLGFAYNF